MTSAKIVFRKAKEIHFKISGGNREVPIEQLATELQISLEEVNTHLLSLKNLRLIRFKDKGTEMIEMTKIGLSTTVG
jgi:transcription initiation factor IIE alpha subunit